MKWTASGLPSGVTSAPTNNTTYLALSGTPTTAGSYRPAISVKGCGGHVSSKQYSVTIQAAQAPAPVITSATTASGTVGSAFSYQITATNTPTSYGATGLPAGLSVNSGNGLISGTPATAATSTVTLGASNSGGTGNATLTLTIKPAAPVITSATTASGTVGSAFSYQITATNSPTSYGATGLPAGLSVNSTSGLISGTPTAAGTSTVTLSATNSGGTGNATLTLTINPATSSNCTSPTAVGPYTFCNEAYNDVTSSTTSSVSLSPSAGNGVEVFAQFCNSSASCGVAPTQTATIGDNINSPETCFTEAPHSPYAMSNTSVPDYEKVYAWYCPSIPAGVTTFTVTTSATAGYLQLDVIEWKAGTIASSNYFESVDNIVNSDGTANTTATIPTNGSTVNANDLITATIATCGATIPGTVGSGYTGIVVNPSGTPGHITEAMAVRSAGTQTATTTWTGTMAARSCNFGNSGSNDTWFGVIVPLVGASQALQVPVITSATTGSGTTGVAFAYQITATNNPTSYGATGLPAGLSLNSSTGLISGTPTITATSTVTLSATESGGTGSTTLTLTINPAPVAAGQLTSNPASLAFGSAQVGSSLTLTDSLTNTGGSSVTISQATATGTGFSISGLNLPISLNPGASVSFNAVFVPQSAASVNGSITVASNASNSSLTVALSGTGTAPGQLTSNPASLAFGSAQVGSSLTLTNSLTNTGGSSVTISQATATGTGFSISGLNAPISLKPGASVTFNAVFAPQSAASVSGGITVVSSASNSTLTVSLSGTGTAAGQLTLAPTALNFGNATVGASVSQTSSLSAAGASVTVSSASLSSAEFSLTGISLPVTIAAGQSVPVTVAFSPQASGSASGVLSVAGNASNAPTQTLSGVGVAPTQHSVSLSWTDTNSGIAGYNVYRGNDSGGPFTQINSGLETTTAYSDTSVAAGQTYYYVATAVNESGAESAYSNEAQGAIPSP